MLDVATIEWYCEEVTDKRLSNFKIHFSREIRDCQKDQGLTAKSTYDSENATNQALLQAQYNFREITESVAE